MIYQNPELLNGLLSKLSDAIADYIIFQIKSGAQAIMLFDSWGGQLPPMVWDTVSRPAIERIVKKARQRPACVQSARPSRNAAGPAIALAQNSSCARPTLPGRARLALSGCDHDACPLCPVANSR